MPVIQSHPADGRMNQKIFLQFCQDLSLGEAVVGFTWTPSDERDVSRYSGTLEARGGHTVFACTCLCLSGFVSICPSFVFIVFFWLCLDVYCHCLSLFVSFCHLCGTSLGFLSPVVLDRRKRSTILETKIARLLAILLPPPCPLPRLLAD